MRKATKIGFIAVFCAAVGLTFPVFNIFSKQLSMDSHENRLMTGLPQVLQSPLSQLPHSLDNFFVDNSPFRYQFVLLNAGIDYAVFGTSQSDQVLPGKDGWLFYKDGPTAAQPVANYQGLTDINDSPEVLAQASAKLQILNDRLAENGCTLVLDLTPSKDRIYREYMPHRQRGKPHRPAGRLPAKPHHRAGELALSRAASPGPAEPRPAVVLQDRHTLEFHRCAVWAGRHF